MEPNHSTGATVVSASGLSDVATAQSERDDPDQREHDEHGVDDRARPAAAARTLDEPARCAGADDRGHSVTTVFVPTRRISRIEIRVTATTARKNTNDIALA